MKHLFTLGMLLAVPLSATAQDRSFDSDKRKLLNKLNNERISLDFKDTFLEDAIAYFRDFANLNITIHPDVVSQMSEDQLRFTIKLRNLRLKSALKLFLGLRKLTAIYKEGVLLIVPIGKVQHTVVTRIYDVRDLLFKLQDFPGPKVELVGSGGGSSALTGVTVTIEEEPHNVVDEDFLQEIVKSNTGGDSWDENENASISLANGLLIIAQSRKSHREIGRLLNLLRQYK